MAENRGSNLSFLISEASFIAILTGGAYFLAFSYEYGFLNQFNAPTSLIRINIEIILLFLIMLSSSLFLLFAIGNFIAMIFPENPALQEKTIRIIIMISFPFWNLLNYGLRKQDILFYIIIFIIIIFFEIIWPIMVFRNEKSIKDKFIADEIAESKTRERGILGRLHEAIGPLFSNLIYIIILGSILAHSAGRARAFTQEQFNLLGDNSNIVVVRIYSDTLVAVPVDLKTKMVEKKIIIQKFGENNRLELVPSQIGPLKFK